MAPARRAGSVVVPEAPRSVVLPSGREVAVRAVGTTGAGLLDVPDDVEVAGWWRGGSRLGDPFGATLLAAHVDSRTQGLGPFAELLSARPGARLRLAGRRVGQAWAIRSRQLVRQGTLDNHPELFDPAGARRLVLVTCAPPYVAARGGYQNLAVLTAAPAGPPEAR
ncbi:class F sortase [Nocardioides zeicaulis]|uniref:Class F sortase n=1 Tax=Nocardioides zeicaulis TaxID=1776857 RepID=A0ABV6DXD7_9ACTN